MFGKKETLSVRPQIKLFESFLWGRRVFCLERKKHFQFDPKLNYFESFLWGGKVLEKK